MDFGATRDYSKAFVDIYIKIIKAAMDDDRDGVLHYSKQLGFLTGYESKVYKIKHIAFVSDFVNGSLILIFLDHGRSTRGYCYDIRRSI